MKSILFASSLKFFFEKGSTKLVISNSSILPRSKKFLSNIRSINRYLKLSSLPPRFDIRNGDILLILNLEGSIVSFPIEEIHVFKDRQIDFITSYDYKLYKSLFDLTEHFLRRSNGELRMSPIATGAVLAFDNEEKQEFINMTIGMLSLLSPENIEDIM